MKCDEIKNKMMDYLFDELNEEEKGQFATHLKQCETCGNEFQNFDSTVKVMNKWPEVESKRDLIFMTPKTSFIDKLKQTFGHDSRKATILRWSRRFAFAAIVVVIFIFRTDLRYSEGQFSLTVGDKNSVIPPSDSPEMVAAFKKLQAEIYLTRQLIAESNKQNQELILTGIGQLARKMDNQRAEDLRFVGTKLQNIENSHLYNMDQTKKSFQDLIKVISTENR